MKSASSLGDGTYFPRPAYAGLCRRFVIQVIDLIVLFAVAVLMSVLLFDVLEWDLDDDKDFKKYLALLVGWSWFYLVLMESLWGTVGFWLAGVKIVDHQANRPSLIRMTFRACVLILGPINPLLDLVWVGSDAHGQTIRDKLSGTYVVRKNAMAIGTGPIRLHYYSLLGMTIPFAEIDHSATAIGRGPTTSESV